MANKEDSFHSLQVFKNTVTMQGRMGEKGGSPHAILKGSYNFSNMKSLLLNTKPSSSSNGEESPEGKEPQSVYGKH
jgi:hypothetical protein